MKRNYTLSQRCTAYILLISLLLQSCNSLSSPLTSNKQIPVEEKRLAVSLSSSLEEPHEEKEDLASSKELMALEPASSLELTPSILAESSVNLEVGIKQESTYPESQKVEGRLVASKGAMSNRAQFSSFKQARPLRLEKKLALPKETQLQEQKKLSESQQSGKYTRKKSTSFQDLAKATTQLASTRQTTIPISPRTPKASQVFLAKGGHEVRFQQQASGVWQALVNELLPAGISSRLMLPIYLESGFSLNTLGRYKDNLAWQKNHIHVVLNNTKNCVFVGKMGLLGGMKKEEEEKKEEGDNNSVGQEAFFNLVKIGKGNFGVVYKGLWKRNTGQSISVALKTLKNPDNFGELSKETAVMESIIHKNVVRFFGIHGIKISNKLVQAIVTELMTEGSVEDFLKKASKSSIKPMEILSMALDAATGMRYLHENDIIHRDLAARNLLISLNNGKSIVKVGDFGLSRKVTSEQEVESNYYQVSSDNNPIRWSAPELFIKKQVSTRSDLWSFGVLLYELFTLCKVLPYEDFSNGAIIKKIKSGEKMYEHLPIHDCPEGIQVLLNKSMNNDSHARLEFDDIIYELKKIQVVVKDNNAWSHLDNEEDNNVQEFVDVGYDSTEGSVEASKEEIVEEEHVNTMTQKIKQLNTSLEQQKFLQKEGTMEIGSNAVVNNSFLPSFQRQAMTINYPKPSPRYQSEEISVFLGLVTEGQQDEAEEMLKNNPDIGLGLGDVTDHAKRTFKNITGFQYAVWALDWHMWTMIKKYLSNEAAREQAKGFRQGSWIKEHGEYASFKKLLDVQQTFIDNYSKWHFRKCNNYLVHEVGGAQFILPIHVLQEYCQPNRPFKPCPNFKDTNNLSRSLSKDVDLNMLGSSYTLVRGDHHEVYRSSIAMVERYWLEKIIDLNSGRKCVVIEEIIIDQGALLELCTTRTQQRGELVAELMYPYDEPHIE